MIINFSAIEKKIYRQEIISIYPEKWRLKDWRALFASIACAICLTSEIFLHLEILTPEFFSRK